MKRGKKGMIFLAALAALTGAACMSFPSQADNAGLSSRGNFIFQGNGEMAAFYAEDVSYLREELRLLFEEMEENRNE